MEKITYQSEMVKCGKPNCRRCREGPGHGPYWYAYRTVGGRRKKSYVGLHLPAGAVTAKAFVGRTNQSPLVGRDAERSLLHTALVEAKRGGETPLILLTGDTGIGKTRLAEETARLAKERGWAIAWTRAYTQESNIPYHPWVEVLRTMTQGSWQRQEIARHPLLYQALGTLLPELQDLLPQDTLLKALSPEQEQLRLWEAIRALLITISENTPVCIVLDDLQWADSSSCELLAYLVRQLHSQPVIIVGTCRDTELSPHHPLRSVLGNLEHEQLAQRLTIQPLTDEQIRALVAHLPEPVVGYVQTHAAGNPFFAEELARSAEASHLAQDSPIAGTTRQTTLQLPTTISAMLDLRLGRLSPACQRLLVRAAVLGNSFEFNAILAMEAGDTNRDITLDLLEEALQAGVLTEEGSGTHITYHFWHPLLVSHLYGGLSVGRRASLHHHTAEALRQLYQGREEERAATIAYHLINGGAESREIAHYAEMAGDRAYMLSAYPEAERYYRLATEQQDQLLSSRDEQLHQALIFERLGECAMVQGHYDEARRYYERVLETRGPQADIPPDAYEAQVQALVWSEIAWSWHHTGEKVQAWQCCERGEDLLRTAGVVAGPAWASLRYQRSNFAWQEGRYQEAEQAAHEALALFEQHLQQTSPLHTGHTGTRLQRTLEGNPVNPARVHILLAAILVTIGQSATAASHLRTALAIFEQYDQPREIAIACGNLGDLYLRQAAYEQAQTAFRRSLTIAERMGDLPVVCVNYGNLGILAGRLGNLVDAERLLRRALALAEQVGDPVYQCLWLAYLAYFLQQAEKDEEAHGCILRALTLSRAKALAICTGFALVILGQMRLHQARAIHEHAEPQDVDTRLLRRARTTLLHALANDELETEMRVEAQTALAEVLLLLVEPTQAEQYAHLALAEARRAELTRLIERAEWLLDTAHM